MHNPYHFSGEETIPSPALIYYRDILMENIKTAIDAAGSAEALWPHVKSHKSMDFTQLQTTFGIRKFKCATIAEAEMVASTDAESILLAYPLVGPNIDRFLNLSAAYKNKTFYALGDDLSQLQLLGQAAASRNMNISCMIDVNTGMNRTGVALHDVTGFFYRMEQISGITPAGLHCYDGNRHEKDYESRQSAVNDTIDQVQKILRELEQHCSRSLICIMGGSPSFPCYAKHMEQVYFSPGTVFVYDSGYTDQFPDLPYIPGAAVLARVVSHPTDNSFTLDAGYKAISAEQGIRGIIPELPHAREAFQSEEHWTFSMEEGYENERPAIGSIVYIIPWHICPTTALYEKIHVVSNEALETTWNVTARDRQLHY